jgi:hypothetical protein
MIQRKSFFTLLFAGMMIILTACQPFGLPSGAAQPKPLPLTGKAASQLGAAALMYKQKHSKTAFSIFPVSASTGEPISGAAPVEVGGIITYGFSPDRGKMAYLANETEDCLTNCLRLLDLRTWKEMIKPISLDQDFGAWFSTPIFNADYSRLALFLNKQTESLSQVQLIDINQAKVIQKASLEMNIFQAAYTANGALALYGTKTTSQGKESFLHVVLLDGVDLHVLWEYDLPEVQYMAEWANDPTDPTQGLYLNPAVVFSPDSSQLYIAVADKPLLVTVDFTNQAIRKAPIQPRASLLDRLMASTADIVYAKMLNSVTKTGVLSQDGRYLYIVGNRTSAVKLENGEYNQEVSPLGLQVVDTHDGTLVSSLDTEANNISLSLDGKTLLLTGWKQVGDSDPQPWTDVLDISSLKVIQHLDGTVTPSRLLDGSLVWLVSEQTIDDTYKIDLYRPGQSSPSIQVSGPGKWMADWVPIP